MTAASPRDREVLLINFAGVDQPGLFSALVGVLARQGVNVLDVGQAVIHDQLTMGLLAEVPAAGADGVLKDLLFEAHARGVQVRFTPVSLASYHDWVAQQGRERYIVTLLARRITAAQIADVARIIAARGMNIDAVQRLSGRVPLEAEEQLVPATPASVEFLVRGPRTVSTAEAAAVREDLASELLEAGAALGADVAVQRDDVFRRNRRLVALDMDSTLIEAEVIDELAELHGVGAEVAAITARAMAGELDFNESFRQRVALLKGLPESALAEVARSVELTEGAERLIQTLKATGYRTALLSGGMEYVGRHLAERLGIDDVHANTLEVRDGLLTGGIVGDIVDGQRKAELLREIAARDGIRLEQVIAVGDGANDLPMLRIAGLGIAFRAKPLVRRSAAHAIDTLGLDGILFLLGFRERDLDGGVPAAGPAVRS